MASLPNIFVDIRDIIWYPDSSQEGVTKEEMRPNRDARECTVSYHRHLSARSVINTCRFDDDIDDVDERSERVMEVIMDRGVQARSTHRVQFYIQGGATIEANSGGVTGRMIRVDTVSITYEGMDDGGWTVTVVRVFGATHDGDRHSRTFNRGLGMPRWLRHWVEHYTPTCESPLDRDTLSVAPPPMPWIGDPVQLDPIGCVCDGCETGEHLPYNKAGTAQIAKLLRGELKRGFVTTISIGFEAYTTDRDNVRFERVGDVRVTIGHMSWSLKPSDLGLMMSLGRVGLVVGCLDR